MVLKVTLDLRVFKDLQDLQVVKVSKVTLVDVDLLEAVVTADLSDLQEPKVTEDLLDQLHLKDLRVSKVE